MAAMDMPKPLKDPDLPPCPGRDDLEVARDDTCQPVGQTQPSDWSGYDCCNFWESTPNVWCNDIVKYDQFNPNKFKYDQYRYQVYAKPVERSCAGFEAAARGTAQNNYADNTALHIPQRAYVQPTTDVRTLQQTMFVPILPSNPSGEKDVTFPMTPRTLGQPDVTTACCVPVMPCQPGFQNLTQTILPSAADLCQQNPPEVSCPFLAHAGRGRAFKGNACCDPGVTGPGGMAPPSNKNAYPYVGVPDTFPGVQTPFVQSIHPPHYNGALPADHCVQNNLDGYCLDDVGDGLEGISTCTNAKMFNHKARVDRKVRAIQETPEERARRLRSMFGAFGASLDPKPTCVRHFPKKDNITEQGNGFHWNYPKHENRLCYLVERNPRC